MASSSSTLDSIAAFKERVWQLGLDGAWPNFELRGWTTMGAFAFASSPGAGGVEDSKFVEVVMKPLLGDEAATHPKQAQVRRLFFESFTIAAADLRRRVSRTDDEPPPRMPTAEREERRDATARRLVGLDISGETEPSDALIDLCASMLELNAVSYVPWEKCTSFDQQMHRAAGESHKREWKLDAQGYLKEGPPREGIVC